MTKQIERAYRSNRRRSWVLIAAVVALAAAIAIPIASGNAGKYYTLGSDKSVCVGDTGVSVSLTLTNKAGSQSLGSANITFPSYVSVTGTTNGTREGNLVKLRNLNLAVNQSLTFTVTVTVDAVGANPSIAAIVKQANNFSGSGGSNLFDLKPETSLPVLTAENCFGTISGRVWNDKDESGSFDSLYETVQPWVITLYESIPAGGYANRGTRTADSVTGIYTFDSVRLGKNYVVCETSPAPPPPPADQDPWAQKEPTGQPGVCGDNGHEKNGWALTPFAGTATDLTRHFRNVNSVQIKCGTNVVTDTRKTIETAESRYTVQIAGAVCKAVPYILEVYAPTGDKRVANFHPVVNGGGKIEVIEKVEWRFSGSDQPGVVPDTGFPAGADGRTLKYDDDTSTQTGNGLNPVAMPYCLSDPRMSDWVLETGTPPRANVLPAGATSCLLKTTEMAVDSPTAFNREDWIYSSVDGYRAYP